MPTDEELIQEEIKKRHGDAASFNIQQVAGEFLDGRSYYAEFESPTVPAGENFYYAFVKKNQKCMLYEDGMDVIKGLQTILDERRNFWQRMKDFDFTDTVAAIIAILISLTFVGLMIFRTEGVGKEFLAIFSVILGYYFGKTRSA